MKTKAKFQGPGGKDSLPNGYATTRSGKHWTEKSPEDFAYSIGSCFLDVIESRLDQIGEDRNWLILSLKLPKNIFDKPYLLTLPMAALMARTVDLKVALVAYNDRDKSNKKGPIHACVFQKIWEAAGKPRDMWSVRDFKKDIKDFKKVIWDIEKGPRPRP